MRITTVGIDLAKNVFQLHGVDQQGKPALKKSMKRAQVLPFFATLPPCLIGMEACGSAHYWARKLEQQGHTVKLMAPQFVKPYVKTNKHDAADAEALCEAASRPSMRCVPITTGAQQVILSLHRAREGVVKARTAPANQIRGLLAEYGIVMPRGIEPLVKRWPNILEDGENELPGLCRRLMHRLGEHLKELDRQVEELTAQIHQWHQANAASRKLTAIPGIGPLTASALVASLGDAKKFTHGRQLAAWLGLVPRHYSTGGQQTLLGISKRGDGYLRRLLIHGARAVIRVSARQVRQPDSWLTRLVGRRNQNVAAVALARNNARLVWALPRNNARLVWALLAHDREFWPASTSAEASV